MGAFVATCIMQLKLRTRKLCEAGFVQPVMFCRIAACTLLPAVALAGGQALQFWRAKHLMLHRTLDSLQAHNRLIQASAHRCCVLSVSP
jgi:hypothetical protein